MVTPASSIRGLVHRPCSLGLDLLDLFRWCVELFLTFLVGFRFRLSLSSLRLYMLDGD